MIKKVKGKYFIFNHLGTKIIDNKSGFKSEKTAKDRLKIIEYFKNKNDNKTKFTSKSF